ncbi:MAG: nicotinamide riboside transporter PnuC [bacterium]|nr:nicotinamide riboside transporter PnuC [bacterium]
MLARLIKNEFSGFSRREIIAIPILFLSVILISVSMKDNIIATAQAIFSLSYSVMAGKGKISCYFFGILGTLCYSFLSFKNAIYGAVMLQMGYFLPMEIIGIFMWKKRMNKEKQSIIKTKLTNKERVYFSFLIIVAAIVFSVFLAHVGDRFPIMDAFSTVFSIAAMYMTVRRCIEQWALWTGVNILSAIMWLIIFIGGVHTFATFLTWSIHLFLGLYFLFEWHKELEKQA